jgi:hypothetical protein
MDDIPLDKRFESYDDILRHLTAWILEQREANQRQEVTNQQQAAMNERLTTAIERLDTTQARIETLLARMIRQDGNGTDA